MICTPLKSKKLKVECKKIKSSFCSEFDADSEIYMYIYKQKSSEKPCSFVGLVKFRNAVFMKNGHKKKIKLSQVDASGLWKRVDPAENKRESHCILQEKPEQQPENGSNIRIVRARVSAGDFLVVSHEKFARKWSPFVRKWLESTKKDHLSFRAIPVGTLLPSGWHYISAYISLLSFTVSEQHLSSTFPSKVMSVVTFETVVLLFISCNHSCRSF